VGPTARGDRDKPSASSGLRLPTRDSTDGARWLDHLRARATSVDADTSMPDGSAMALLHKPAILHCHTLRHIRYMLCIWSVAVGRGRTGRRRSAIGIAHRGGGGVGRCFCIRPDLVRPGVTTRLVVCASRAVSGEVSGERYVRPSASRWPSRVRARPAKPKAERVEPCTHSHGTRCESTRSTHTHTRYISRRHGRLSPRPHLHVETRFPKKQN
jgi:hypothetical protein